MRKARRTSVMVRLVALLVITLTFTMCFVSGTFAKYVSSATGSDTGRVAKWVINVGSTNIATTDAFTFDLFNTVNDTKDGNPEGDVKVGASETIIAPGTTGSFRIDIENKSEVNAEYEVAFTVTNASAIPVEFSTNGTDWKTYNDISELNVAKTNIAMTNGEASVTMYWRWVFESGNDNNDTDLGKVGTATLTVTANVTATQVD